MTRSKHVPVDELKSREMDIFLAMAGYLTSLAAWRGSEKVPARFKQRLEHTLGPRGAGRVMLRRFVVDRTTPFHQRVQSYDIAGAGPACDALQDAWLRHRGSTPTSRGGMSRTGEVLSERDATWHEENGNRQVPVDDIVATYAAWEWDVGDEGFLAIEMETDCRGLVVGALLLKTGAPGGRRMLAAAKSAAATLARMATRQYWMAWNGSWALEFNAAITTHAKPESIQSVANHQELFKKVSGRIAHLLVPMLNAFQAACVGVFIPVGATSFALLAGTGYSGEMPRGLRGYGRGMTGLFCTSIVPEEPAVGVGPNRSGQVMAFACRDQQEVERFYHAYGMEYPGTGSCPTDAEIDLDARAAALAGPIAWSPFKLHNWGPQRQVELNPGLNLRLLNDARGVVKVMGRQRCLLDGPAPPPYSRRELRRMHGFASLVGFVFARLVANASAELRERLLREVATACASNNAALAADEIRGMTGSKACVILSHPEGALVLDRRLVAYAGGAEYTRWAAEVTPTRRPAPETAWDWAFPNGEKGIGWREHGIELVLVAPPPELGSESTGNAWLVPLWTPAILPLLAILASTRRAGQAAPRLEARRKDGGDETWRQALRKLRREKARQRAIDALLKIHLTFEKAGDLAAVSGYTVQHVRRLLLGGLGDPEILRSELGVRTLDWEDLRDRAERDPRLEPFPNASDAAAFLDTRLGRAKAKVASDRPTIPK